MNSLMEPLLEALKASNWSVFFVIIAIAVMLNLRSMSEFLEDRSTRHQRFVQEALKLDALNHTSRLFLEEELNYFIFKRITGISADAVLREKLQDVISRSGGELQIRQISRAREFIRMSEGKLQIVVTKFDFFYAVVNLVFGAMVSLIGLALFMLPGLVQQISITQTVTSGAVGTVFFAFAMFIVAQAFPTLIARRLAPKVQRLEASVHEKCLAATQPNLKQG